MWEAGLDLDESGVNTGGRKFEICRQYHISGKRQ